MSSSLQQQAIVEKWKLFLNDHNNNNDVVNNKEMLAYGDLVPSSLRSEIWFVVSGGHKLMSSFNTNHYKKLYSQTTTKYLNQINKDYQRTFITKDLPNTRQKLEYQLRRMLIAYANYNPSIGYAQGMNMIAGFILRQFMQHDYYFDTKCKFEYNQVDENKKNESSFSINSNSNTSQQSQSQSQ
eukprot:235668_1